MTDEKLERELRDLRVKYGARGKEPTTAWIARLGSELLAAQSARRHLLDERSRVAEYLGGNPTEPPIPLVKRAVEELQQLRAQVARESAPSPPQVDPDLMKPPEVPRSKQHVRTDRGDTAICPLDQNPDGGLCLGDRCPWFIPICRGSMVRECAVAVLGRQALSAGPLACEVLELLRAHLRRKA